MGVSESPCHCERPRVPSNVSAKFTGVADTGSAGAAARRHAKATSLRDEQTMGAAFVKVPVNPGRTQGGCRKRSGYWPSMAAKLDVTHWSGPDGDSGAHPGERTV